MIVLCPTIRAAKNDEKFLTSGPARSLHAWMEVDKIDIGIRLESPLRFAALTCVIESLVPRFAEDLFHPFF
jgi:hypothetical protein